MYIAFIIFIFVAALLITVAVLIQNPKSGMAANFGASNQVAGARQTADFLEKSTWGLAIAIVVFSLGATMSMPENNIQESKAALENHAIPQTDINQGLPNQFPAVDTDTTSAQ